MSLLSRRQMKKIDRLFFNARQLQEEVKLIAAERVAMAADSADPTAREAVEHLAPVPHAMGYDNPEAWLQAAEETWGHYRGTPIGDAMRRRYDLKEVWQRTQYENFLSDSVYFVYRAEFISYAALMLAKKGIDLELSDGSWLSDW